MTAAISKDENVIFSGYQPPTWTSEKMSTYTGL